MLTVAITVKGDVQGVFYRQSTKEKAISLGLSGFVENKTGGDVYIIATGLQEKLNHLISWCRLGPPKARVLDVLVEQLPDTHFEGFSIRRH